MPSGLVKRSCHILIWLVVASSCTIDDSYQIETSVNPTPVRVGSECEITVVATLSGKRIVPHVLHISARFESETEGVPLHTELHGDGYRSITTFEVAGDYTLEIVAHFEFVIARETILLTVTP
ncbi:MAG: hypothetical protein IPJ88_16755 [Myxococcales bacterium]|nr:MAG: hypothetical protein IPJ88_16755 [Myxococcales bacterium]